MSMKSALSCLPKAAVRAVLLLFLFAVLPCRAVTTLTLAHIYVPEHTTAKTSERFAEAVKTRSQGRILVRLYDEASMGNQMAIMQGLKNGSLDLSILSQGVVASMVPEFNALGLPYLFPDPGVAWRVLDGTIGQELVQKLADKGLVILSFMDIEIRQLSNSVRPILKPADVVGLKIRTPPDPMAHDVISALGGKPQEINFSDLYNALQRDVVDGQENSLSNFRTSRLEEVQKYISLSGHKYSIFSLLISKTAWDALSDSDRAIVRAAAKEAAQYQRKLSRNAEEEAYRSLIERGVRIDKVDLQPFVAATAPVYDKWYASPIGDFVRRVVQAAREKE